MHKQKPIIAMDVSSTGKGGGPYTSTMNVINSSLKNKYDYRLFTYKTEMGRFVSIKRIMDIVQQLREINPDIVHFTGLQLSGFHIAIACIIAGFRKNIVVIHGSSTEALNIGVFKKLIIYILEFITLMVTSTFYGVSHYSSTIGAAKRFRKKSSGYVYNLPILSANKAIHFTKEQLGFKEEDIVVVTVARIIKDKGYHILASAIQEFVDLPNIKFLIVGEGAYLAEMKTELSIQKQSGQVKFLGYRSDVASILPACDIFVLPTLHETLSIALLEASSYNLPLIASNVGGVPEIITNEENGLLVEPSDSGELANAIKTIAADENLRKKMGKAAKEKLADKFSEESIVGKIDAIYRKLLNR